MHTIVVAVYKRYHYLCRFLKSVSGTKGNDSALYIFQDDCSCEARIIDAICAANLPHYEIIVNEHNLGIPKGPYASIVNGFAISPDEPFIIKLDSDTVQHPDWLLTTTKIYNDYKSSLKISAVTPYIHKEEHIIGSLHYPYSIPVNILNYTPGCALLIDREFFNSQCINNVFLTARPDVLQTSWDWDIINKSIQFGYTILSPTVSYVQHIGDEGTHSPKYIHRSINYIGEMFV